MAFGLFKKSDKKEESHGSSHYFDLTVKNIINETKDAITIVFEQPAKKINYKKSAIRRQIFLFLVKYSTYENQDLYDWIADTQ